MAGKSRSLLAILSLLFISGTIILLFLLILAGAYDKYPLNRIFWLQADTTGIPNAPDGITHWTQYNHCPSKNGININCPGNSAAYPVVPQENFQTTQNIPHDFIGRRDTYYYLSRFLYSFYIIDVFFASLALFAGLAALFSAYAAAAAAALSSCALFCMAFSASIMTAVYVMAAKAFRGDGRFARVGVKAFAFTWTCVALLLLATVGFAASYVAGRKRREGNRARMRGGRGFGRGKRSSVGTEDSQRGINKEYSST